MTEIALSVALEMALSPNYELRKSAAAPLVRQLEEPGVLEAVCDLLRDQWDTAVTQAAVEALGVRGDHLAFTAVLEGLSDVDEDTGEHLLYFIDTGWPGNRKSEILRFAQAVSSGQAHGSSLGAEEILRYFAEELG